MAFWSVDIPEKAIHTNVGHGKPTFFFFVIFTICVPRASGVVSFVVNYSQIKGDWHP